MSRRYEGGEGDGEARFKSEGALPSKNDMMDERDRHPASSPTYHTLNRYIQAHPHVDTLNRLGKKNFTDLSPDEKVMFRDARKNLREMYPRRDRFLMPSFVQFAFEESRPLYNKIINEEIDAERYRLPKALKPAASRAVSDAGLVRDPAIIKPVDRLKQLRDKFEVAVSQAQTAIDSVRQSVQKADSQLRGMTWEDVAAGAWKFRDDKGMRASPKKIMRARNAYQSMATIKGALNNNLIIAKDAFRQAQTLYWSARERPSDAERCLDHAKELVAAFNGAIKDVPGVKPLGKIEYNPNVESAMASADVGSDKPTGAARAVDLEAIKKLAEQQNQLHHERMDFVNQVGEFHDAYKEKIRGLPDEGDIFSLADLCKRADGAYLQAVKGGDETGIRIAKGISEEHSAAFDQARAHILSAQDEMKRALAASKAAATEQESTVVRGGDVAAPSVPLGGPTEDAVDLEHKAAEAVAPDKTVAVGLQADDKVHLSVGKFTPAGLANALRGVNMVGGEADPVKSKAFIAQLHGDDLREIFALTHGDTHYSLKDHDLAERLRTQGEITVKQEVSRQIMKSLAQYLSAKLADAKINMEKVKGFDMTKLKGIKFAGEVDPEAFRNENPGAPLEDPVAQGILKLMYDECTEYDRGHSVNNDIDKSTNKLAAAVVTGCGEELSERFMAEVRERGEDVTAQAMATRRSVVVSAAFKGYPLHETAATMPSKQDFDKFNQPKTKVQAVQAINTMLSKVNKELKSWRVSGVVTGKYVGYRKALLELKQGLIHAEANVGNDAAENTVEALQGTCEDALDNARRPRVQCGKNHRVGSRDMNNIIRKGDIVLGRATKPDTKSAVFIKEMHAELVKVKFQVKKVDSLDVKNVSLEDALKARALSGANPTATRSRKAGGDLDEPLLRGRTNS